MNVFTTEGTKDHKGQPARQNTALLVLEQSDRAKHQREDADGEYGYPADLTYGSPRRFKC